MKESFEKKTPNRDNRKMREVVVIRGSPKRSRVLCANCSKDAVLVTVEEAVKMSRISARAIYRLVKVGESTSPKPLRA